MDEQHEHERASRTPLSIRMELMNCEFATMHLGETPFPIYTFQPANACPFNKTQPDQECRTCTHHRIQLMGTSDAFWHHRYHRYGAVMPILSETAFDAVIEVLEQHDGLPLRRPGWEPEGTNG